MIGINRITDGRASFLDEHALEEDFAFAELEVEATVLFEGVLQFREYEQTVLELAVDVSVIRKRRGRARTAPLPFPRQGE